MPKLLGVVGGKHSGKTTVIEHLISELTYQGYRVGTVKEMVSIPTLDTPQKETDRYTKAGSEIDVAVPRNETVIFIRKQLGIQQILPYLKDLDYILLEGFETEQIPRIIAAKTAQEVQSYLNSSTIAVTGIISTLKEEKAKMNNQIPIVNSETEIEKLITLIKKALI